MKYISKQLICICIITLLVGVSYTSAIRVDNKIPIENKQDEDDCGCNDVSDVDIIKLEKQLKKLERNSKLLLVLSKDLPIEKRKIEELSHKISIIKEELASEPPNPILCVISIGLFILTMVIFSIVTRIIKLFPFRPDRIWDIFSNIVMALTFEELVLVIYHCGIGPYVPIQFNLNNQITDRNHLFIRNFDN